MPEVETINLTSADHLTCEVARGAAHGYAKGYAGQGWKSELIISNQVRGGVDSISAEPAKKLTKLSTSIPQRRKRVRPTRELQKAIQSGASEGLSAPAQVGYTHADSQECGETTTKFFLLLQYLHKKMSDRS